MIDVDRIVSIISLKGPVIPTDLKSYINSDTIFLGAILSDLASKNKLKITHVKKGGSPFYYIPGHEEKLQGLSSHLNEKDMRVYDLLKEKKILRDTELTPLQRVCMRSIKDYAVPLEIKGGEDVSLYWKWYLLGNEEVVNMLKQEYEIKLTSINKNIQDEVIKGDITSSAEDSEAANYLNNLPNQKEGKINDNLNNNIKNNIKKNDVQLADNFDRENNNITSLSKPKIKNKVKEGKKLSQIKLSQKEDEMEAVINDSMYNDTLYLKTITFLSNNSITPSDINILRKEKEISGKATLSCDIGNIHFYFLVKNKKICNHNDVNDALVKAQQYHLALLFIYTGSLTKKAQEIYHNSFNNIICKKLSMNDEIYI